MRAPGWSLLGSHLSLGVGRDDGVQPQAGGGGDERGVEGSASEAVADQPHPDRLDV